MKAADVINIINLLVSNNIEVYVDGGWCVDALVGEQTREHLDLDIAMPRQFDQTLRAILREKGFEELNLPYSWECNYVLKNREGLLLDVHTYQLDELGNNLSGVAYESVHLTGAGVINDCAVKCISPDWTMKFHTGYELDENDYHDVVVLSRKFGLPIPDEYDRFINTPKI
jgi:lincosamide nucleotidyltransferase A/C/D/E